MNELEQIKAQLNDINVTRVKYQTLKEQAQKQCAAIETKYNIKSVAELEEILNKAKEDYQNAVTEAQQYINETKVQLAQYNGIL